jgi:hypothetical protein
MLIGGYAVIAHGHPRLTNDMDIVIANDDPNIARVIDVLEEFGFPARNRTPPTLSEAKSVVRMGVPPVKIEILNYLEGVDFDEAYSRRETHAVEDIEFDLISLEDLLANKSAVGRDKDLLDVKELRRVNDIR